MVPIKRQDEYKLIAALLHDTHVSHGVVFNTRSLRLTLQQVDRRVRSEGISFLTKTLPRLGKAFDKALTGHTPLSAAKLGFSSMRNSELPLFCGEFFSRVFDPTGRVLQDPCAESVRVLRDIMYLFYKYKLPYTEEQELKVVSSFIKTEDDIKNLSTMFATLQQSLDDCTYDRHKRLMPGMTKTSVAREARILLSRVFANFDLYDIVPRHGPGAVATKQKLWEKFRWTNVSYKIRQHYPLDAYFFASLGHVADDLSTLQSVTDRDLPAQVILVPKDSRGPRLISCEPVDYQWIQQGISRRLVQHIEDLELTKFNVFFTDQAPNQRGALLGSMKGKYSTLDLNEASDRVSLDLVRVLFPAHVYDVLSSVRSSSTVLPDGQVLQLQKFAPMGSALCFPILALTVWAILTAAAPDADTRESILVYGDDVIVPTAYAACAMEQLESFGLKINRDKSCTGGLFRESCGMDAFKGTCVTPVRIRTTWSSTPCPNAYASWISYANSFYRKKQFNCYDLIVGMLRDVYHEVPSMDMDLTCPSLVEVPESMRPKRRRTNRRLQKTEWLVRDLKSPTLKHEMPGWSMLLRFFTEAGDATLPGADRVSRIMWGSKPHGDEKSPFSVSSYTSRRTSMLVRRWR